MAEDLKGYSMGSTHEQSQEIEELPSEESSEEDEN